MQTTTPKGAVYWTVKTIVTLFMAGAAYVSFMHIVHTAAALGLGAERWTVPFIIDGLAVLGLIGRSPRFAAKTQTAGLKLTIGAGLLSLAANIAAGENLGQRIYGALIVAAFVVAEWYGAKLSPAPAAAPVEQVTDEAKAARRSEGAKKAAATRAANKARTDAEKAEAAERRRIARMEREMRQAFDSTVAPVSPAPGEAAAYL